MRIPTYARHHARRDEATACGPQRLLPTHATSSGGDVKPRRPQPGPRTCQCVLTFVLACAALGLVAYLVRTDPVVSIDAVSATGLDGDAASPSFDVAVRITTSWFHLVSCNYRRGTDGVSWAGGAVSASGALQDVNLDPMNSADANTTARSAAVPGDAREIRRGGVRLDVAVAYEKDVGRPLGRGFRARCTAVPLGRGKGNSVASCSIVKYLWLFTHNGSGSMWVPCDGRQGLQQPPISMPLQISVVALDLRRHP